jgi:carbonic anhydrase
MSHGPALTPDEALTRLKEGHDRFAQGSHRHNDHLDAEYRAELGRGQTPYASVLTCADSRVAPEHIFDAGLGDIFVCRNAGNVFDEVTLGSIEYAAAHTGCSLLVVMGHSSCGAAGATVAYAKDPTMHESPNVDDVLRRILPAVIATRRDGLADAEWANQAARQNVENVCRQVRQRSPLLRDKIDRGEFRVVGAWYDISTSRVTFID